MYSVRVLIGFLYVAVVHCTFSSELDNQIPHPIGHQDGLLRMPIEVGAKAAAIGSAIPAASSVGGAVLGSLGAAPIVIGSVAAPPIDGIGTAGVMSMYHIARTIKDRENHQKFNSAVSRGVGGFRNGLTEVGKFLMKPFAILVGSKLYLLGAGGSAASRMRNSVFGRSPLRPEEETGSSLKAAGSSILSWAIKGGTTTAPNESESIDYDNVLDGSLGSAANRFVTNYHGSSYYREAANEKSRSMVDKTNATLTNTTTTTTTTSATTSVANSTDNIPENQTGNVTFVELQNETQTTLRETDKQTSTLMSTENVTLVETENLLNLETAITDQPLFNNTRLRRQMTVSLAQALDLIEAQDLRSCVARVICELTCNYESLKSRGKKIYQNLQKISESTEKGDLEPKVKFYRRAEEAGLAAKPNCGTCRKHYPSCKKRTSKMLAIMESVNVI